VDDVVGIIVQDCHKGAVGLMTWGRLYGALDENRLIDSLLAPLADFGLNDIVAIRVCSSLAEVSRCPYFHEALLRFAWSGGPAFGETTYPAWLEEAKERVARGEDLYLLGRIDGTLA
jgi:hypothetical protein